MKNPALIKARNSYSGDRRKMQKSIINTRNRQLSQNIYMSLNTKHTDLNNNILIIGGSGCGKTFRFAKPNIMQMFGSYVITDPKGEICRDTAGFLKANGYNVKCLNLLEPKKSSRFNPFVYINSDIDVIKLIGNLIKNTTPKASNPSDPFWEKAEGMLLQAIFQYVWREGVLNEETGEVEHNIGAVLQLMNEADFKEDPRTGQKMDSLLDKRMDKLELKNPKHPAVLKYNKVMRGAADTVRSIIISANSRLAPLENEEIISLMSEDEINIPQIGTEKTVVYCVIPDSYDTYNFLVGILYTQMFQILYQTADFVYGGELPVHVTFLLDEFANVALPDGYCSLLSTMRSRSISSIIIIQNLAQVKALFEKTWETITGNCDTLIFLGGNEKETQKYVSEQLGKMTINKMSHGQTKGKQGSSSTNDDVLGREVMLPEEIRKMKRDECIVLINGYDAVKDKKIDTVNHPLFKMLCSTAGSYSFDGRLERSHRKTMEKAMKNGVESRMSHIYTEKELSHMMKLDEKEQREYKLEYDICMKTGDPLPERPPQRVFTLTVEELMSIDVDEIDDDFDITDYISDEEMEENERRCQEEYEREMEEEYNSKIDIKKELKTPMQAELYLRLTKEEFSVPQIRTIMQLVKENEELYTVDMILNYFSPNMEIEDMQDCIELLVNIAQ